MTDKLKAMDDRLDEMLVESKKDIEESSKALVRADELIDKINAALKLADEILNNLKNK